MERLRSIVFLGTLLLLCRPVGAQLLPPSSMNTVSSGGVSPVDIVAGEFNSNSTIPGVVVSNDGSNNVHLFFFQAEGGFSAAPAFPPVANPGAIAVGDFDEDGIPDLAVVDQIQGQVTILLLDGSGNIKSTSGPFAVGKFPQAIAAAQFGSDTHLDLAVANDQSNDVSLLIGDGHGNFTPYVHSPFAADNGPRSLAVADFNGDGLPDLAVANALDNTVTVLLGQPRGGFYPAVGSPFPTGFIPTSVVAGDFNSDGHPDLVVANAGSNNVMLLLGNGAGGFGQAPGSPFPVGTYPVAIAVADFNGDSFLDLAVANSKSNNITLLLGNGQGSFTAGTGSPFSSGGTGPIALAVADFNQDGAPDLAIANNGSNTIAVALNGAIPTLKMVSSASYTPPVALNSLVSIFGSDLPAVAATAPPPQPNMPPTTCLNGVSVSVTDSSGATYPLTLIYAAQGQINALAPPAAVTGAATFTLTSSMNCNSASSAALETGSLMLESVAPSLFSANQNGSGVAWADFDAAIPLDGFAPAYSCPTPSTCSPAGLDVSSGSAVLVLFGTGIRNRAALSDVTVSIGTQTMLPVFYAGPAGSPGLDQVSLLLPSSLAGSGIVNVSVSVGTMTSNQVTLCFPASGNQTALCAMPTSAIAAP